MSYKRLSFETVEINIQLMFDRVLTISGYSIMVMSGLLLPVLLLLTNNLWTQTTVGSQLCPAGCTSCKFDAGNQLVSTSCMDIRLQTLPQTLIHLEVRDLHKPFMLPLGQLRSFYLSGLTHLQELTIHNYMVRVIQGPAFQNNTNLTTLIITNNSDLKQIQQHNFKGLVNLKYLDLSQNGIAQLDDFVFQQLTKLRELKIVLNNISSVHENSFKGLTSIKKIDLAYNKVSFIHKNAFSGLNALQEVNFMNNKLARIEEGTFSNLHNLISVNLRNNYLVFVHPYSMSGDPVLTNINLAHNHLQTLSSLFLQNVSNPDTEINLSRNNLTILSAGYLTHVSLKALYLVGNLIQIVEADSLKDSFIRKIDLQQNRLHSLPEAIKSYINKNTVILLANNPWTCDCDIYWMPAILTNQTQPPVCAEPIKYKGWTISNFSKTMNVSCYFGSFPVPTKVLPHPPKQGIVTPALGTKTTSTSSNTTNVDISSTETQILIMTEKGDNFVPIIAGSIAGLLFLISVVVVLVYLYKKFIHSKIHIENLEYCEKVDFNSKSTFTKHQIEDLQTCSQKIKT